MATGMRQAAVMAVIILLLPAPPTAPSLAVTMVTIPMGAILTLTGTLLAQTSAFQLLQDYEDLFQI
jgi:hypothetical protein